MTIWKQSSTSKIIVLLAFLAFVASLVHYFALPPAFLKSHFHVWRNHESFISLVELIEQTEGIEEVRLRPDGVVEITTSPEDLEIGWRAKELERTAELLRRTKVMWVERRSDSISFFGGEDYKMGRYFQVHVLYGADLDTDFQQGGVDSCLELPVISKSQGECLDFVSEDMALHYLWADELM